MPLSPVVLAAVVGFVLVAAPAAAQDGSGLGALEGRWTGSGTVTTPKFGEQTVRCTLNGDQTGNRLQLAGTCRALLVFSRAIGADIRFDPADDRYSGSYTGSLAGTASLAGRRRGNTVDLQVRWPKPVYGDTRARMRLVTTGDGFRIVVTDEVDGREQAVTDIAFARN